MIQTSVNQQSGSIMKFKERYKHELHPILRALGVWRINEESVDFKWGYWAPGPAFKLILSHGGYFNQRFQLCVALGWGTINFILPFKTKLEPGCNPPRFGIEIHDGIFWLHYGGKYDNSIGQVTGKSWWTWYLPYFTLVHDDQFHAGFNGKEWVHPRGHWKDDKHHWEYASDVAVAEKHPFTYTLNSGEVQHRTATVTRERRRWYRKWFKGILPYRTEYCIDIKFDDEVGERTGSWKGGTVGCGWELLHEHEPMEEALRRMEKERKF